MKNPLMWIRVLNNNELSIYFVWKKLWITPYHWQKFQLVEVDIWKRYFDFLMEVFFMAHPVFSFCIDNGYGGAVLHGNIHWMIWSEHTLTEIVLSVLSMLLFKKSEIFSLEIVQWILSSIVLISYKVPWTNISIEANSLFPWYATKKKLTHLIWSSGLD